MINISQEWLARVVNSWMTYKQTGNSITTRNRMHSFFSLLQDSQELMIITWSLLPHSWLSFCTLRGLVLKKNKRSRSICVFREMKCVRPCTSFKAQIKIHFFPTDFLATSTLWASLVVQLVKKNLLAMLETAEWLTHLPFIYKHTYIW